MNDPDRRTTESRFAADPAWRLSAAILRIIQSLDLATVLDEAVESARALTGACHGVITTIDRAGRVRKFVTSGLTPEERREMVEWPDGLRLLEHLRDLTAPLRVRSAVKRLRRKLGDAPAQPVLIFSEHSVGYRMPEPGEV